jgi:hypothetical protein
MSRYAARQLLKSLVDGLYLAFGLRGRALLGLLSLPTSCRSTPITTTASVGFLVVVCGDRTHVGVAL